MVKMHREVQDIYVSAYGCSGCNLLCSKAAIGQEAAPAAELKSLHCMILLWGDRLERGRFTPFSLS